jgi:hypothetical protein
MYCDLPSTGETHLFLIVCPVALTEEFSLDSIKQQQWKTFVFRSGLAPNDNLETNCHRRS